MKNFKTLCYCSLVLFCLISCKKEKESSETGGFMSAKVDGKDWSATLASQATKVSGVLSLAGTGSAGQININLMSYASPGTFQLGGTAVNPNHASFTTATQPIISYSNMVGQGSGQLIITSESDGFIEGTFSFTAKNPTSGNMVNVTEGKFKIKLR